MIDNSCLQKVPYDSGGCDKQVKIWPLGGGQPETDAIHHMPVSQVAWISKMNMLDSEKWDKILRRLETGFKSAELSMWLKTGFQTREYCLLGILCQLLWGMHNHLVLSVDFGLHTKKIGLSLVLSSCHKRRSEKDLTTDEPFRVSKRQCHREQKMNNNRSSINSGSTAAQKNGDV
ncbi:G-protein beta WD-40 repeat-containing protein [Artemisia annua]|uniref:G-protein beta WD-40 repeat-containing protein n=1 Tax=Artemisia annua TaxID=35608 RepID=A0A2U1PNG4_ARTAN|nr:G-protein beta WD-40 repeat-containing protein [Artemisia annua]